MIKLTIAIGALAIGLVVLFGLYLVLKGARNVQLAVASVKWPTTSGTVLRSDTTRDVVHSTRTTSGSVTFSTKTVIRYAVNGHDYTTDVLHFGQTLGSGDKSVAALQALRYPAGKKVTVSYNPSNPAVAVMKPGLHAEAFWLPGAGLAFLLPAVLCLTIAPAIMRSFTSDDRTFANAVDNAIEQAQRHAGPVMPIAPPKDPGGDAVSLAVLVFFGAIAGGLGMLALTSGLQRIWHGYASQNWPTTSGTMIFAGEEVAEDSADTTAYAHFVYEYEVAGTKHFNNVRRWAQVEGGSTEEAAQVAARYVKGAQVRVSYFPTDPDVAVLEPGNSNASLLLPGIGVVLLLASLAIFIFAVPSVAKG